MSVLFDPASYEFKGLAIPFVVAAAATLGMGLYVLFMRGAPLLRATFLALCGFVLLFVVGFALLACTVTLEAQSLLVKLSLAPVPLGSASVLAFDLALARRLPQHARLVIAAYLTSLALALICVGTDLVFSGVLISASGMPVGRAGPLQIPYVAAIGGWIAVGSIILLQRRHTEPSPLRRRQFTRVAWAFSIGSLGGVDLLLGYGIGYYPLSCFFITIASLVALRSLLVDDLLRAAALDRRVVVGAFYVAAAGTAAWWLVRLLPDGTGGGLAAALVVLAYFALRAAVGLAAFLSRDEAASNTPIDRALARFTDQTQRAEAQEQVVDATKELLALALGMHRVVFLLPGRDGSWLDSDGELLPEGQSPGQRLMVWFAEHGNIVQRDDLTGARLGEYRALLERLFDSHEAEILIPLVNRDDVVGIVLLAAAPGGRAPRAEELDLLSGLQDHATAGLVYARMYEETAARVEVAKEVELAAAVQEAFVPGGEPIQFRGLELCGLYEPATRCGGDWWSVYPLPGGQILVLIGDVTGHGVAAAMVTAAAKGCNDVAMRMMGKNVDLVELLDLLNATVRRTGGTEFHMTCFASLIDPATTTVTYANAGHVVPYLARRRKNGAVRLDVLAARGNPLGTSETSEYKAHTRQLSPGDVLVWYTDGLVESTNAARQQYGDRRFQRHLKRLAEKDRDVTNLRDEIVAEATVFTEGHPADDDITLVVARLAS